MAQGQGAARKGGTDIWTIRDVNNQILAKFDHSGSTILDGALVDYIDADNDGIAESVTPATAVRRYLDRAAGAGDLAPHLHADILERITGELLAAAAEAGHARRNRLRRLRTAIDRTVA